MQDLDFNYLAYAYIDISKQIKDNLLVDIKKIFNPQISAVNAKNNELFLVMFVAFCNPILCFILD